MNGGATNSVAIYGAGMYGEVFLEALTESGINVDCFVDEYSSASKYNGKPVLRIKDAPKNALVYVSVCPYSNNGTLNLKADLQSAGFEQVLGFVESLKSLSTVLRLYSRNNSLWMRQNTAKMVDHTKIAQVRELLSDNKSKVLLDNWVRFRTSLSPDDYILPDGQVEYFPDDIPLTQHLDALRFVDCGSYDGDTVEAMLSWADSNNIKTELSVSFEPDRANAQKVSAVLQTSKRLHPEAHFMLYPCGVWSNNEVLKFRQESNSSSGVATDTSALDLTEIPLVSIDSVLSGCNPNFIKMDIEGAEREAILGGVRTIREIRPVLAICIYHKPEDIWDLPLLINEISPDYDMYMRTHEHMCLSTVLYCLPRHL